MTDQEREARETTLAEALAGRRWKRAKCPVCGREFALSPKSGLLRQHMRRHAS